MYIKGYIRAYDGQAVTIVAPFRDTQTLIKKNAQCEVRIDDGRSISADQRKKIYATFADISDHSGHTPDEVKAIMKYYFIAETNSAYFSLADTDMTTARLFLQFLVEWCVEWNIQTLDPPVDRAPDVARYLYRCLCEKRCCITGQAAELHHVDVVGRRSRKIINHKGMLAMPLTREKHTEVHAMGQSAFNQKYHVFGIALDDNLCDIWKLKKK